MRRVLSFGGGVNALTRQRLKQAVKEVGFADKCERDYNLFNRPSR